MSPLSARRTTDRAFERLYRRHALDVYRYALAVLRNQADAEDVTQTTFLNAYRALERGETPNAPQNWLIAIAHNVCRQRFRTQSRRVQEVGIDVDVADHFVEPEDDDAPSPEDIRRALGQLAFNQRAALVMRELEGRSYAEIADLLGLSVSAVETLLFRARRALREQLEGTLTCGQAEALLSKQLDVDLAKDERAQLRAHLRECPSCRTHARSQRAQRRAFRALGALPLPQSLASLIGGGAPVAAKVAAVVVTAGVAGGVSYDVHRQLAPTPTPAPSPRERPVGPVAAAVTHRAVVEPSRRARATTPAARPDHARRAQAAAARVARPTSHPAHPTRAVHPTHPAHPTRPVHPLHPLTPARHVRVATAHSSPPPRHGRVKAKHVLPAHGAKAPRAEPPGRAAKAVTTPAPGLTQTSQNGRARNAGEGHLHP